MMATPQPTPQQPIYAAELNFFLDRHFARITSYFDDRFRGNDARLDGIIAQMTVDRHESQARDEALLRRIENVEATQKVMIDMQREMIGTMQAMQATQQAMQATMQTLQATQQAMQATMQTLQATQQAMQQEMREGFAAQAERHNELMVRVERLERNSNPPAEES